MGSVSFELAQVTTYLPKLYRFDPFARENGSYRWLSGEEVISNILQRELGDQIDEEMVEAKVIYEVPAEAWDAVSSKAGQAYLRDDLIPRLYPLYYNEDGMFQVEIRPQEGTEDGISLGRFSLRAGGDLSQLQIQEQINGLEYAIILEGQSQRLLAGNYRSAFEFLGEITKASLATEELRLPGDPRIPVVTRPASDEKAVHTVLKIHEDSKRVHDLLVWLGLAQTLIAPPGED
jgi:hypothetical protein